MENKNSKKISSKLNKFFLAFLFASRGIVSASKERNIKFHFFAATIIILFGFFLTLSKTEWFVVLILIGIIISLEMINTSIEELANITRDKLNLSYSETTRARDVSAGAVLIVSMVAAIIGIIIFLPKIL